MHRALHNGVFAAAVFCFLIFAPASRAQNQQISVSVFSDVQVPELVMKTAEQSASRIFSRAGIEVAWINCQHGLGEAPSADCTKTYSPGDIVLRITRHVSGTTSDSAFGIAWLADARRGRYADVFWPRVEDFHSTSNLDVGLVLGAVMAHEMGHLLLGINSHSVKGLMQPRWRTAELEGLSMGTLLFLPEESKKMRAVVSATTAALIPKRANRHLLLTPP